MDSPKNKERKEKNIYKSISSFKNSLKKDKYKEISSNKKSITLNNEENLRNFTELKKSSINQHKPNKPIQKNYIFKKKEEIEKEEDEEEEEEINSEEYVSSTNLDVETNTYINYTNKINEEITLNKNNTNKIIHYPGRLKNKILSDDINNKIEQISRNKDNNNILVIDNKEIINDDKNLIILNNINNINENNVINDIKINNNSDFINIINRKISNNKENKNNSNSIDYKYVFTPNNEGKKKIKALREIIFKKIEGHLKKKNNIIRDNQQSQTINIIENKNINNLKLINNQIIKNYIKLNFDVNQKKNIIKTANNENTTNNNSFEAKDISIKDINQIISTNNKVNISLYKKNIIRNIGAISINDQKYHLMPKSIKKAKTQGRVGKIIYNKKNKRNNFLYINNNQNTINKTINTRYSLNHNKKINRISPINNMNNSQNFKSISINKENNFHSLKNLKIDNVQKSLKKYLLEDEYLKIIPMNKEKNNNSLEKDQLKPMKDLRNKKFVKNHFKNPFNGANTNMHNINPNIYRIKKIVPLNISQKSQLRSFNSCFPYKINKNALNNYTNEQILTTINNNHNKKIDMANNFKKNVNLIKKKVRNISDKKYNDEKNINKKNEISYNILPDQCKKNILSFKKIKNLKNKIFSTDFSNIESQNNNNKKNNIKKKKKNKPLTTRIKIDLVNEENSYNKKINTKNNMVISNNAETINTIWNNNNNSIPSKIYYEKKSTLKDINFKTLPFKCLSPKLNHVKQIIEKKHPSKIKEMYNKINHNNKGRNSYNIYLSSSMVENNNKHSINNSNIFPYSANHSNNIIFLKNSCPEDMKERYSSNINTDNYKIENLSKFPTKSKKIFVFNNVNNYNINNTNNTLNNITDIKNNNQNDSHICLKRSEELNNFSSIINKPYNRNPKKIYINKPSISHKNSKMIIKNQNSDILEQNIIYIDNANNKNNNINSNKENKYQYNKNMIYKLNKYNNLVNKYNSPDHIANSNIYINNKLNNYSMSNNKGRNTINDKSYTNLYSIKESKTVNNRHKNNTIDFEKNKKEIETIQE